MVRAQLSERYRVSPVRPVQLRIPAGADRVSAFVRAVDSDPRAVDRVEHRLRTLRGIVRGSRFLQLANEPRAVGIGVGVCRAGIAERHASPSTRDYVLWLLLSAMGSYMLLGATSHITQNVASVPFLWILPLVLYLVTFILCFEGSRWYQRRFFLGPLAVIVVAMAWGLNAGGDLMEVTHAVPLYCAGLFVCCMFYHGELASMKPAPRYLTRFYLMVSLGGALGGLFIGVVAPMIFITYYEFGAGLVVTALLAVYVLWPLPKWIPAAALGLAIVCAYNVKLYIDDLKRGTILMTRSFYGTLRVKDTGPVDEDPRPCVV